MSSFLEKSVFLRTLNFLRVQHPYRARYNLVYPLLLSGLACVFHIMTGDSLEKTDVSALLEPVMQSAIILFPFYLASLAAVSTFSGPKGFDEPFKMHEKVTLIITHRGGEKKIEVSPRYFLSLLFGYSATICLCLLLALFLERGTDFSFLFSLGKPIIYTKSIALFLVYFFFFQILILTVVSIYYLSDFVHRLGFR